MTNSNKANFLKELINKPKQVFLIDALGALLTSILLFGVLAQLEQYFRIPSKTLYILSGIAFCLFIYSISCHLFIKSKWKTYLQGIIILNSIYIVISTLLLLMHYEELTGLGITYFVLEFIIIGIIIKIEYLTLRNRIKNAPKNNR